MTRKEIADALKLAAAYLFFRYRFSVAYELGLKAWGRRRADLVANKINGTVVIVEVKSCIADLRADNKWHEYLDGCCDRFYFALTKETWAKIKRNKELLDKLGKQAGVIVLQDNGYARIVKPAKQLEFTVDQRLLILARLAWRNGDLSKRKTRARKRVYLDA